MGKKAVNTGKVLGFSPLLVEVSLGRVVCRKVVGLGEVSSLHCWGLTMLSVGAEGGWVTQNQNAVIAEVNIGFKVNKIS